MLRDLTSRFIVVAVTPSSRVRISISVIVIALPLNWPMMLQYVLHNFLLKSLYVIILLNCLIAIFSCAFLIILV